MNLDHQLIEVAYLLSAILFVVGLKRLQSPATARGGNALAALAMLVKSKSARQLTQHGVRYRHRQQATGITKQSTTKDDNIDNSFSVFSQTQAM